jgi:hypothetical protein
MSEIRPLPKLAAMFLTNDHRVPPEVLTILSAQPPAPDHPLDGWEVPLDVTRHYGLASAPGVIAMRPPEY